MAIGFKAREADGEQATTDPGRTTTLSDMRIAGLAVCVAPSVNRFSDPRLARDLQASGAVRAALAAYVKNFGGLGKAESRALLESVNYGLVNASEHEDPREAKAGVIRELARAGNGSPRIYGNTPISSYAFEILFNMVSYMKSLQLRLANRIVFDDRNSDKPMIEKIGNGEELDASIVDTVDPEEIAALSSALAYASRQLGWKSAVKALSLGARLYNASVLRWDGSFADFLTNALKYGVAEWKQPGDVYGSELYKLVDNYGKNRGQGTSIFEGRQKAAKEILDSVLDDANNYGKGYDYCLRLAAAVSSYHSGKRIDIIKRKERGGFRVNSEEENAEERFVLRLSSAMKRLGGDYAQAEKAAAAALRMILADVKYTDSKALLALLDKLRMKVGYAWFTRISHGMEQKDEDAERIADVLNSAGRLKLDAFSLVVDCAAAAYRVKVKVELVSRGMIILDFS